MVSEIANELPVSETAKEAPAGVPPRVVVAGALQTLLASTEFPASQRQRRLLIYLVEEKLAGRHERLKAYNIATSVLGRSDRFDPQADPIVRVEMSNLRQCLARYYLTEGRDLDFKITIPKGSYVPLFDYASAAGDTMQPTADVLADDGARLPFGPSWRAVVLTTVALLIAASALGGARHARELLEAGVRQDPDVRPALLVSGFANVSDEFALNTFAAGVTADVASTLARFKDLQVFTPGVAGRSHRPPVEYRLDGIVARLADNGLVTATLRDMRTGYIIWQRSYSASPDASDSNIVRQIAQDVGDPYGVISMLETKSLVELGQPARAVRNCVMAFHDYMEIGGAKRHRGVRECLEEAVKATPRYSSLWADLALVYVDEYRHGYNRPGGDRPPLDRAIDAASHAITVDRTDAWAHAVLAIASWFRGDHHAFTSEADKALTLNPNDPLVLAEIGTCRFFGGDRAGGLALVHQALDQGSGRPATYRYVYALDAYLRGDYALALDELQRAGDVWRPAPAFLLSATYGKLGRVDDARKAWAVLKTNEGSIAKAPRAVFLERGWSPAIIDLLMQGIAGVADHQARGS